MEGSVLAPWHSFPSALAILLSALISALMLDCTLTKRWLYFSSGLHSPCTESMLQ